VKPGDLALIGDSKEAREYWAGWKHVQPFLVVRRLSAEDPADASWVERFGYVKCHQAEGGELKIPAEECMMVMNTRGSFMRCPAVTLKPMEGS
jgi:hypothetical protein